MSLLENKIVEFDENILFFKNEAPRQLFQEIVGIFKLMDIQKHSLCMFFDDSNQEKSIQFNDKYALYQNIKNDLWGSDLPSEIRSIFNKMRALNIFSFIWISNEISSLANKNKNENIRFFWNCIHELQHFKQDTSYCTQILKLNGLFRDFLNLPYIQLPCEYEAEQTAKRHILSKFGEEALNEYIVFMENLKPELKPHLDEVKKINIEKKCPLKEVILDVLKKNQKQLKENPEVRQRYPSIDIDKICDTQDICAQ